MPKGWVALLLQDGTVVWNILTSGLGDLNLYLASTLHGLFFCHQIHTKPAQKHRCYKSDQSYCRYKKYPENKKWIIDNSIDLELKGSSTDLVQVSDTPIVMEL